MQSLVYGWSWNYTMFSMYRQSTTLLAYDPATAYAENFALVYNFKIYISLQSGNTGNSPDASPDWWYPVAGNFIGYTERIKYTGRYLDLTFALNRYFSYQIASAGLPGFLQPPYPDPYGGGTAFSSIYITNYTPQYASLGVTSAPQALSAITSLSTGFGVTSVAVVASATSYVFAVHIPIIVFNSLGVNDSIRTAIVRRFVDIYNPSGISYEILTY